MNNIADWFKSLPSTTFLQEPAYRWFLAFGAFILFGVAWRGILGFIA